MTGPLPAILDGLVVAAAPGAMMPADRTAEELRDAGADIVYIAFDGDKAGREGAERVASALTEIGITTLIVQLPEGNDLADEMVAAERPSARLAELLSQHSTRWAREEEPEPEAPKVEEDAPDPLPPAIITDLLDDVLSFVDRYVVLPGDHERSALALFVAHSYAIDGAHCTPYILVVSPEKRSGKSRLLQVLELLVATPWGVIGTSEAAMFRKIAKDRPTLLLDEIDAIFGSHTERTEPLRAILNAGNRPGATVARCVGESKDVEDFPIFCAKVLAGIDTGHRIPDTIRDRSVTINMTRKTRGEPVERLRHRVADAQAEPVRIELEGWAAGSAVDILTAADPDLPQELDDRAAEAWEPLFAIADLAGGDWPQRARSAAIALSGDGDRDEVTTGTLMLGAIRDAFGDEDRVTTISLLRRINADEQLPFGGWNEGRGIDGRRLARLLKPYGIRPRTIRIGDHTEKGYMKATFAEPWERWLPTPFYPSHPSHPSHAETCVTQIPHGQADVTAVTDVTDKSRCDGIVGAVTDATVIEEAEAERIAAEMGVEV